LEIVVERAKPIDKIAGCLPPRAPLAGEYVKAPAVKKCAPALYLIIADKMIKGAVCLLLALGVYKMAGIDLSSLFDRFILRLDPENQFLSKIGDLVDQITPANMRLVATGTFLYSMLSLTEGVGLIFRAPWANWLAIGESAFFIPIEIYELARHRALNHPGEGFLSHRELGLLVILACNILIVWYLYANRKRLFHRGSK
jgi:uncharacterized membrane protein (DUF2068 family)